MVKQLVVVKATVEGEPKLITRVLTTEEVIALEKHADLRNDPLQLLDRLNKDRLID